MIWHREVISKYKVTNSCISALCGSTFLTVWPTEVNFRHFITVIKTGTFLPEYMQLTLKNIEGQVQGQMNYQISNLKNLADFVLTIFPTMTSWRIIVLFRFRSLQCFSKNQLSLTLAYKIILANRSQITKSYAW